MAQGSGIKAQGVRFRAKASRCIDHISGFNKR